MTLCQFCGNEISDHHAFCFQCGHSIEGETGQLTAKTVLQNRYVIVKTLGQGGMGAVYHALDRRLNDLPVAIKEMSTNAVGAGNLQAAAASFKREADILLGLKHPALPRIIDFFSIGQGRWYLVMDYIQGRTLKDEAMRLGRVPERLALDWGIQLCDILSYLHAQNPPVIFRDLKPSNIMLTPGGSIQLIDFGIARHFRPGSTADTAAYGSTGFAPPEQYGENQTDPRSDLYALGATLHCMLTGHDPNKNPFSFAPPSRTMVISPQLEAAVMKAVAMNPADRHQSAQEMKIALVQARTVLAGNGFEPTAALAGSDSNWAVGPGLRGPEVIPNPSGRVGATAPMRSQDATAPFQPDRKPKAVKIIGLTVFAVLLSAGFAGWYFFGSATGAEYVQQARTHLSAKQYDAALTDAQAAVRLEPKSAEARIAAGIAYYEKKQMSAARRELEQAITLDPKQAEARYRLGLVLLDQKDYPLAIKQLTEAAGQDPLNADIFRNRAYAYEETGHAQNAIQDYTRSLKLAPKDAETYVSRGYDYDLIGKYDLAVADYTRALALDPNNAYAYNNRGVDRATKGDLSGAIADLKMAVTLKPDYAEARKSLKRLGVPGY
ncbi:MAG: protein kinase domain-containing protein [Solirubrobacterales bacterium]